MFGEPALGAAAAALERALVTREDTGTRTALARRLLAEAQGTAPPEPQG